MTGSASNITTQWTFRDGKDYVLSLTTTETPHTISFWISDKITGEEWTGCYDENCIEVLTKRTGCFKSFSTFLAMVKSAMLKKSESVVLELLNIQDLAAISVHRHGSFSNDCGIRTPLNFDFYSDVTVTSAKGKPFSVPSNDTNINTNGMSGNGSNSKAQPPSSLNKRKYLIVSYLGEFDKVHYPLPLNYSNPPDLNVMQQTIIKLKAEVTSLKSAKNELEERLESIKMSGLITKHSHENNNDANIPTSSYASNSSDLKTRNKEPVFVSQKFCKKREADMNGNNEMGEPQIESDLVDFGEHNKMQVDASQTCSRCSGTLQALLATIRDLENTISSQRDQYFENLEKLENENHFLRHKVKTSEKCEMELWNNIKMLKEKVEKQENLEKERKNEAMKDSRKNRCRLSRHDSFYRTKFSGDAKPGKKVSSKSPTTSYKILSRELETIGKKYTQFSQRSRSNSNSTASYSSADRNSLPRRNRVQSKGNCRSSSSSSYHAINFANGIPKSRSASSSPSKRFDPTAYVSEKKMKLSKIANLRMQKIESRIRAGSAGSMRGRSISPSPSKRFAPLTRTTISPTTLFKLRKSLSGEIVVTTNRVRKMDDGDAIISTKEYPISFQHHAQKKILRGKSRPSSAESCRKKVVPPAPRFSLGGKWPENSDDVKFKVTRKNLQDRPLSRSRKETVPSSAPAFTSEFKDRLIRSPAKRIVPDKPYKNKTNSIAVNTSFTCDKVDPLVTLDDRKLKTDKSTGKRKNEKKDISFLQEKLSALNAFLETCKPKD